MKRRWRIYPRGDGTLEAAPVSPTWGGGGILVEEAAPPVTYNLYIADRSPSGDPDEWDTGLDLVQVMLRVAKAILDDGGRGEKLHIVMRIA